MLFKHHFFDLGDLKSWPDRTMQSVKGKQVSDILKNPAFAIVTSFAVFVIIRNSLFWCLPLRGVRLTGFPFVCWTLLFYSPMASHLRNNAFFTYLDLTGKPAALLKYKIQEEKGVPVNWIRYKSALKLIAFNLFVIGPLFNLASYPLSVWRGIECGYELPSFLTVVWHIFCCVVVEEILFYYFHRILHHPKLYKHCHKIHHEWTAPTGIVSIYSHPIEYIIAINLPIWLGPFIVGSHLSVAWLWYVISGVSTTVSHSGYHLPFFPSNEAHDFHHQKFTSNFGVRGVMDRLHGTDDAFRRSRSYDRNFILFGLTSAREMFPDPPKTKQNGHCHRNSSGGIPTITEVSYPS